MSGQLIDVSELMSDPDFVAPIVLVSRQERVSNFGANELIDVPKNTVGSVQPVSGKTLARIPEAYRVSNVKEFFLREKIVTDSRSKYPDVLVKNGVRYAVQVVFDWSDWGAGWSQGTCVQEAPTK